MRKQVRIKLGLNSAPVVEGSLAFSEDGKGEIVGKRQPVGGALLHMLMARSEGKAVVPVKKPRRGRPPKAKGVAA
jgi:hypothetical protein